MDNEDESVGNTRNGNANKPNAPGGNRSKLVHAWLHFIAILFSGFTVGSGATLLIINSEKYVYDKSITIGVCIGFSAFALFFLLRLSLIAFLQKGLADKAGIKSETNFILKQVFNIIKSISGKDLGAAADQELIQFSERAGELICEGASYGAALFGASVSMGIAIGIVGTVISMASVVAANKQVDRMDYQNNLIKQQIYEATATRISQLFAAQLPSLLEELKESKARKSKSKRWTIDEDLLARIQALIDATQPYSTDKEIALWRSELHSANNPNQTVFRDASDVEDIKFSPERGQLLSILIAAGFPFGDLPRPLNFSFADLRGVSLVHNIDFRNKQSHIYLDLGDTILHGANFRNSQLKFLDFKRVDLSGAILPSPDKLLRITTWTTSITESVPNTGWTTFPLNVLEFGGANLYDTLIESPSPNTNNDLNILKRSLAKNEMNFPLINMMAWDLIPYRSFSVFVKNDKYFELLSSIHEGMVFAEVPHKASYCNDEKIKNLTKIREFLGEMDSDPNGSGKYTKEKLLEFLSHYTHPAFRECLFSG